MLLVELVLVTVPLLELELELDFEVEVELELDVKLEMELELDFKLEVELELAAAANAPTSVGSARLALTSHVQVHGRQSSATAVRAKRRVRRGVRDFILGKGKEGEGWMGASCPQLQECRDLIRVKKTLLWRGKETH